MKMTMRGIIMFGVYFFLVTLPLNTALIANANSASGNLVANIAVGLGFIGYSLMALEFALISRIKAAAQPFGEDALQLFHDWMGSLALVFILAHPILVGISGYPTSGHSTLAVTSIGFASLAEFVLILLIVTSVFRKRLRIKYEIWQVMHGLFAFFILVASLVHVFVLGRFTAAPMMKTMWLVYGIIVVSLIIWYRILKPITHWNKRWEVVKNKAERGDAHTLVVKPVGHDGFTFEPGQYAWIKQGKTPFAVGQHPISFSSNGDVQPGGTISFTIKNLGDWSGKVVPNIQPGEQMWVDGPHGVLSSDREQGMGYVLIAGGVGITPLYSMCQTIADREDVRPVFLFYGARDYESLTFREEFEALKDHMSLQVIYVLSEPGDGWQGEKGFINAELLEGYLPKQYKRFVYFICGPEPLMDSMEDALPKLGIPREKVLSERFGMV